MPSGKPKAGESLADLFPDVASQWHPTLNGDLTPKEVRSFSDKKAWWKCDVANDHVWETKIRNRTQSPSCPFCIGRMISKTNSLATLAPHLADFWHPTKNGDLTPDDVGVSSPKRVWWKCDIADDHEWQSVIHTKFQKGSGCPYCAGQKVSTTNSLATLFPEIASQWHPTKNGDASPETTSAGSHKKVWWKCDKGEDHQWDASIKARTFQGQVNCPFCVNQRVSSTNNLQVLYPEIASQWHPTKNGDLTPEGIIAGSNKKYWWICDVAYDHEWEAYVNNRTSKGSDCPYCHGREASSTNNLKKSFPEIASQWHPTKNGVLTASEVTDTSGKKVWWKCDVADDHEWSAVIASRSNGSGCPFCAGKKVSLTNRLDLTYPEVAKQWHPTKNGDLEPDQFTWGTRKRVWWKCDVADDHEWRREISGRTGATNSGCPSCAGLQVSVTNSLQTRFPLIASEWHPTKNGDLTPDQVVAMTHRKVWWKCSAVQEHEWESSIGNRTNVGAGCPLCVLTPRSAQEIRLAHELEALIDFDLEAHKLRLDKRTYDMDIIIQSLRIVIEFDGAYWHRNKADIDLEKTKKLEIEGWNVIRVRERPLDSIHKNDVMVETLAPVKEVADLVLQKITEVTGVKISKLKEYLASDEPWREKEALVAIRDYQAENARKKAERDAKRKAKKT